MDVAEGKQSKDSLPIEDDRNPIMIIRSGGCSSSSCSSSSGCNGGHTVTNNTDRREGSSDIPSPSHCSPPPRRLIVDIRQNSYHHYQNKQDEEEEDEQEEGGMEEGRTLRASSRCDGEEERRESRLGGLYRSQSEGTLTMRKGRSFFSIGVGAPSPRRSSSRGANVERGTAMPSPRSRLPRLSPRAISMLSPRNLLRKKPRPMALKTEGSAFDGIPSPPALQSQRTKLICENNSYYRWAEEEARYTDPHQLVSPWSSLNIAMPLSAFFFQLTSTFFSVPIAYYVIKNLGMNAAATNVAQQMTRLPQAFQIPIGLLTDCVPIRKRRRKHYILIGWLLHIGAMTALAVVGEPDITSLVGLIFLSFTGGQIMDLAQRALIIQRSRHEREDQKGVLMVTVNLGWTWGNMIVVLPFYIRKHYTRWRYILGTFSYESNFNNGGGMSIGNIATFNACIGAAFLPFLVTLYDTKVNAISKTRPMGEEMADVWAMVQRKSVLMPMLFVGIFQVFWVPNSVWTIFLVEGLHFTEWNIGLMGLLGSILGACGASMYRLCFMHVSWRKIFVFTSLIMAGMNCLTLLLVFRVNKTWGISDYFFASGDNLVESLVDGFHIMPISIMYMGLCPGGAEGTALAAIQTFASLAVMMSSNIGLLFLRIWDVDGGTIAAGNFEGVWKITLLCGLFQLVGVFFVKLLPRNAKHQEILQSFDRNIVWGGICFIAFVILAFILTIGLNVTYMVHGDLVS